MDEKTPYLIIGGGKLAKHFCAYFNLLGVEYLQWEKSRNSPLESELNKCDKILLAISDNALQNFVESLTELNISPHRIIHFSGALEIDGSESVHPLMTFSDEIYSIDIYKSIPFVTIKGKKSFSELFPELPNKSYQIDAEQKSLYHSLCSIAGNFAFILWKAVEDEFNSKIGLPKNILKPFLYQTLNNFFSNSNYLTGPFSRKDWKTIDKQAEALKETQLSELYDAFYQYYFGKRRK